MMKVSIASHPFAISSRTSSGVRQVRSATSAPGTAARSRSRCGSRRATVETILMEATLEISHFTIEASREASRPENTRLEQDETCAYDRTQNSRAFSNHIEAGCGLWRAAFSCHLVRCIRTEYFRPWVPKQPRRFAIQGGIATRRSTFVESRGGAPGRR